MKLNSNFLKTLLLVFLFLSLDASVKAQTNNEIKRKERKEKRLFNLKKNSLFLQEPYFFVGLGLGPLVSIPAMRTSVLPQDGSSITEDLLGSARLKMFANVKAYVGAHYKKHIFTLQIENLDAYSSISKSFDYLGEVTGKQVEISYIVPYLSFMYQYDALNNNKKIGLQPGMHAGLCITEGWQNGSYSPLVYSDNITGLIYQYGEARFLTTNLHKVGFGFGPSLNFEVNFARWFSLNLYQQFTYVAGPVAKNEIWYKTLGSPEQYGMSKSSLLNYSVNLSFRFKMYIKGTKQKINDLIQP